jgi:hypothetical protein
MTDLDKNLEAAWGPAARFSEHKRGEIVRYCVGEASYTGKILWIAAPGPSSVEGHAGLPTRYIVIRDGWSGFPDVVYSSDILS